MKKKETNKTYTHVKRELKGERKISFFQILSIIVLSILCIISAIFSDDSSYIAIWIRELFTP
ncbi:hypothetical protein CHRY9293_00288 [Chryseobacterium potabilaquae]|uniref:Uncharacterized protein n=1 Tax=Chryseobacterium potabilaquae TaxID=2675057 RepID=A0A6N4X3V9_9FLAO|nr:hypothetical protein CHRY9293_00288 [Chryseobacterium potabilaquae]